jgi:hypothetical protein
VLGPLPPLHRLVVSVLTSLACGCSGAWLASALDLPLLAGTGAGVGAALGAVLAALAVLDDRGPGPSRARHRRTR